MRTLLAITFVALTAWGWPMAGWADGTSQQEMKGLDEQVQEVKSDVLSIGSDLGQLEEGCCIRRTLRLPSSCRDRKQDAFRLDAVQIRIDGELARTTSTASRSSKR